MKNLFKLATVAAALTLSANVANANEKIGFADPGYLLQNHPEMVAAAQKIEKVVEQSRAKFADEEKKLSDEDKALTAEFKKIEDDAKKLQGEQKNVEASLKKKIEALEKEAPRLRSKEIQARQTVIQNEQKAFQNKVDGIQKREADFKQKAADFQKKVTAFQEKIQKVQAENNLDTSAIQKKAVDDINVAIKTVAEAKGYTLVLLPSSALYAKDENANITQAVFENLKATVKPSTEVKAAEKSDATDTKPTEQAK